MTPEELLASFDEGPLPELYNAIFYTTGDSALINDYGYACSNIVGTTIRLTQLMMSNTIGT